jgi:hypothetical protein
MDGVNYSRICELAKEEAMHAVARLAQDRMLQGEALDADGLLSWGNEKDETRDNESFAAFESYLNYIHYVVQNTPIPLHV